MQACPQVVISCQGCQRAGRVAIPLVQEGCESRAHPLGTLRAPKLLCFKHLKCLALEFINDPSDLAQQEGPGVDEVNAVHHDGNDAVPALEAPGQAIFDEKGVAEHKAMLLIPKEDGAFPAGADLTAQAPHTGLADNAEELGVVGVLVTDVLNRSLCIMADIPRVPCSK